MKKLLAIFLLLSSSAFAAQQGPAGLNGQVQYNNNKYFGGLTTGQTVTTEDATLNETQPADRIVSGTTDTILSTDYGRIVVYNNASAKTVTIPAASTPGFTQGFGFTVNNTGGTATLTPATGTINGVSDLTVGDSKGCYIRSDGANYQIDFSSCNL